MDGIIEFHDTLLRADSVVYVEQTNDDVVVTTDDGDLEITYHDCSVADFRDAWRKAMSY